MFSLSLVERGTSLCWFSLWNCMVEIHQAGVHSCMGRKLSIPINRSRLIWFCRVCTKRWAWRRSSSVQNSSSNATCKLVTVNTCLWSWKSGDLHIAFLQASADLNWTFVFYCISTCTIFEPEALQTISLVRSEDWLALDENSMPTPGKYELISKCKISKTVRVCRRRLTSKRLSHLEPPSLVSQDLFRRSPIGKRKGRPAASYPATSTQSDSKRSSTNQVSPSSIVSPFSVKSLSD